MTNSRQRVDARLDKFRRERRVVLLLARHSVWAQALPTPGTLPPSGVDVRIRLRPENTWLRGTVMRTVDDSLWIASCQGCAGEAFWIGNVSTIEQRAYRGGRAARIRKGIGIGVLAGIEISVAAVKQCESGSGGHSDGPPCSIGYIIVHPLILAGGAIVGGLVGAACPHGEWIAIWPSTGVKPPQGRPRLE